MGKIAALAIAAALLAGAASSADAQAVRGFGRGVPMSFAMRQIVPDGWSVTYGVDVEAAKIKVSWRGGADWRSVVDAIASKNRLVVSYDDAHKLVRIGLPGDPTPPAERVTVSSRGGFVVVPYRGGRVASEARTGWKTYGAPQAPAVQTAWKADRDRPLRAVLEEWGERAGWSVVWNSGYEYRLEAGASFGGDFVQAAGDLVRSMQTARPPVTATFYKGNRVLLIANDNAGAN